jgi:uroporphyrinogen decarboxylase
MRRRDVLKTAGGAVAGMTPGMTGLAGCRRPDAAPGGGPTPAPSSKRQLVLDRVGGDPAPEYVPAAFFLHFGDEFRVGPPAIEKHTEYFRFTGMDFVKIQYEAGFPRHPEIETPADWTKMPVHGKDFYEGQIGVVEGLVNGLKEEALVVCTLYSPFMLACESVGAERVVAHIEEDPEAVRKGLEAVSESVLIFVRECARVGLDGFYASTQGGEAGRFSRAELFTECVMPSDLVVQNEINESTLFNILHICDYHLPYDDLTPFLEYPGDVVSCPLSVAGQPLSTREAAELFSRPTMGGLDRKGVIAQGSPDEIRQEVQGVLSQAPERHILGADCTVPAQTSWENLRTAISTAHGFRA